MDIKAKILVIGDIMLDEYIIGNSSRLSPEAPIPVIDVDNIEYRLGGAANVAHNLQSIGVDVILCGLVGDDYTSDDIKDLMEQEGIPKSGVITDKERRTTRKARVISGNSQIVRYDIEDREKYCGDYIINFLDNITTTQEFDVIIVSDYGKGVITKDLMIYLRNKFITKTIIVDPNVDNYMYYKNNADIITPNKQEAKSFYESDDLDEVAKKLLTFLQCEYVLMTKGKDGLSLYNLYFGNEHVNTMAKNVYDVSGAGDTVIAVLAAGLGFGMPASEAAYLANKAAGIVVGDLGTSVVGDRLWKN